MLFPVAIRPAYLKGVFNFSGHCTDTICATGSERRIEFKGATIPRTYEVKRYLIPDRIIHDSNTTIPAELLMLIGDYAVLCDHAFVPISSVFAAAVDVSGVYGEAKRKVPKGSFANKRIHELRSIAAVQKPESRKEVHYRVLERVAA